MNIRNLIIHLFPHLKAIGVTTRINLNYLLAIELTMAWNLLYKNALGYEKIIVVGMDPDPKKHKPYTSPLNGMQYYDTNQHGDYFIADIVDITSIQMVKSYISKGISHSKFAEMEDHESHFGIDSTFSPKNIGISLPHDPRLIIQFDSKNVTINSLGVPFVGLSNPAFYVP